MKVLLRTQTVTSNPLVRTPQQIISPLSVSVPSSVKLVTVVASLQRYLPMSNTTLHQSWAGCVTNSDAVCLWGCHKKSYRPWSPLMCYWDPWVTCEKLWLFWRLPCYEEVHAKFMKRMLGEWHRERKRRDRERQKRKRGGKEEEHAHM